MKRLHVTEGLPAREIGRRLRVSHSSVIDGLRRAGILNGTLANDHRQRCRGQPFGYDNVDGKLVKNRAEQSAILLMRQLRESGLTLRDVADELNRRLVPTKNNGIWQANTVRSILQRISGC